VWIEFEAGDPTRPIWTGGWFAPGEIPRDEAGTTVSPRLRVLRTSAGLILALDDHGSTIALSDGNGNNLLKIGWAATSSRRGCAAMPSTNH
jgi:hypothetical protein